ncbi:hypothetical protein B0T24DRAFT_75235 [Lasiosphaeria ovina]|uniref:Uncharacterized protein n=1 Tax=Lasiosphaeria ovina TaxID=92902 RepID=A0AAE0TYL9_9PEZI|nr:hypothetical protein B0T24DRAFT_75235 [Lasiosphaeria ovina]
MPKAMAARRMNRMMTMTAMTSFSFILADFLCDAQEEMCEGLVRGWNVFCVRGVGFTFLLSRLPTKRSASL